MTIPSLKKNPSLPCLWLYAILLPLFYLALNYEISRRFDTVEFMSLTKILVFFIPCFFFLKNNPLANARYGFYRDHFGPIFFRVIVVAIFLNLLINHLLPFWLEVVPLSEGFQKEFERIFHKGKPYGLAIDIASLALIPAICEELLFRGIIQTSLTMRLGTKFALFLTALLFALHHLNPWHFPFLFGLGIFFGWIFLKTRSLGLAMVAHFVNNLSSVVLFYLKDL